MWSVYKCSKVFSHNKGGNLAIHNNMDDIMLSKTEKDKYHMILLICEILKTQPTQRYGEQNGGYLWYEGRNSQS